jgi:beta-fructofuranosidase
MHEGRPSLHLTPPSGWMNDPNGMCFVDGRLHMTYQHNPDAPEWGRMSWGHAVSSDLLHWEHLPVALAPGDDDAAPDAFGCWSGCIVDDPHLARLFYTGVRLDGDRRVATICLATSTDPDRQTWAKDPRGPLIDAPPDGIVPDLFRDPFVWHEDGEWQMVVGAGTTEGRATVLLYRSPDLERWRFVGPLLTSDDVERFGEGHAPMWECPQIVQVGERHLLIVSVVDPSPVIRPSHVTAFVGRLVDGRFAVEGSAYPAIGPDLYAPAVVRTPDGRWMLFGWIPEDPPGPGTDRVWAGALSFPRIVSIADDGRVTLGLAREVAQARGRGTATGPHELSPGGAVRPKVPEGPFELSLDIRPGEGAEIRISLHDTDPSDPLARVSYLERDRQVVIARRGIVSVAGRSSMATATVPLDHDGAVHVRVLVDGTILELEVNGETMGTARLASHRPGDRHIVIGTEAGEAVVARLEVWPLGDP